TGFEPATPCTPCKCATRLRHAPTGGGSLAAKPRCGKSAKALLAAQQLQHVLELGANLPNDLLALARVRACLVARQALTRAADREALFVQQAADLADDQHVLPLIIAAIAAPLDRLQLRKFLLPVAQYVRLHAAKLAHFTDGEVALSGDWGKFVVIPGFQHK